MTHICVGKLTIIDSDNGLSPEQRQAIIWTHAGILLIGPLGTNPSQIIIGIQTFSFNKMHLKVSSAKWRPFCLGLNELKFVIISLGPSDSNYVNYGEEFYQNWDHFVRDNIKTILSELIYTQSLFDFRIKWEFWLWKHLANVTERQGNVYLALKMLYFIHPYAYETDDHMTNKYSTRRFLEYVVVVIKCYIHAPLKYWLFPSRITSGDCHSSSLILHQHWSRLRIGICRHQAIAYKNCKPNSNIFLLIHRGCDKTVAIFQTTFLNVFIWTNMLNA